MLEPAELLEEVRKGAFARSHRINYASPMSLKGYSHLIRRPGVRGGNTIVDGTRIGVHDVIGLLVSGANVDEVTQSFTDVTRAQVLECLAYYEEHRSEIDALVARQREEMD